MQTILIFSRETPDYAQRMIRMRAHYWAWMRAPGFCDLSLVEKT